MEDFRDKRVTVAGLGHFGGGIAVARWLVAQGARVVAADNGASIDGRTEDPALIAAFAAEFGDAVAPMAQSIVEPFLASTAQVNRRVFDEDHAICRRVSPHYDLTREDRIFARSENRAHHFWRTLHELA